MQNAISSDILKIIIYRHTPPKDTWTEVGTLIITAIFLLLIALLLDKNRLDKHPETKPYKWGYFCGLNQIWHLFSLGDSSLPIWYHVLMVACGMGIIARKKWFFIIGTVTSFTAPYWIINFFYIKNRWSELDYDETPTSELKKNITEALGTILSLCIDIFFGILEFIFAVYREISVMILRFAFVLFKLTSIISFLIVVTVQIFAVAEWLKIWLGCSSLLAFFISLPTCLIPIVGTILAIKGVALSWQWSSSFSIFFFCLPYIIIFLQTPIKGLLSLLGDPIVFED